MSAPVGYTPKQGDVILVRAVVSRVTMPRRHGAVAGNRAAADSIGEPIKIAARTQSDTIVRCTPDDIEKVEAFSIKAGTRVRWWEGGISGVRSPGWCYGEVLAVEQAAEESDRPHKDNLWIKDESRWPRLTKFRKEVERA